MSDRVEVTFLNATGDPLPPPGIAAGASSRDQSVPSHTYHSEGLTIHKPVPEGATKVRIVVIDKADARS